jgi:hypothetical protein
MRPPLNWGNGFTETAPMPIDDHPQLQKTQVGGSVLDSFTEGQ